MMTRTRIFSVLLMVSTLVVLSIFGCGPKQNEMLVATIGDEKMSLKDYEELYLKNNGGKEAITNATMENKKKFLDLIINYRLKVQEALRRGYADDADVKKELAEYRKSLAIPFLLEREVTDPNVKLLYERQKVDIRISHIQIQISSPKPEDTLKAWNTAMDLIKRSKAGERFDSLAKQYSMAPTAKIDGGDVRYFTAGMTPPAFENACYSLNVGEVYPYPVRTQYGYHVIKLTDKKPRLSVKASHVLIQCIADSAADTLRAWNQIQDILKAVRSTGNYDSLARQFSQDPRSAPNGGDLGYIQRNPRIVPEFEDAVFSLKVGEISNPVRTRFGYHLIKVTDIKQPPSFDEAKEELKQNYQQVRYMDDYQAYVAKLRKGTNYRLNDTVLQRFLSRFDSTKTTNDSAWDARLTKEDGAQVLFSFDGQNVMLDSVISKLRTSPEFRGHALNSTGIASAIQRISEMKLVEHAADNVQQKYPEFSKTMKDYEEGILLYKIQQVEVWNKVAVTDSALHVYFDKTRDTFRFPDRVDISEIYVTSDSAAKALYQRLKAGEIFDTLAARYSVRIDDKVKKGRWGLLAETDNILAARGFKMEVGAISEPFPNDGGYSIIKVNAREKARLKTFEEAGAELSNRFQENESKRIEREWSESLRRRYPVEVHEAMLEKAFMPEKQESKQ